MADERAAGSSPRPTAPSHPADAAPELGGDADDDLAFGQLLEHILTIPLEQPVVPVVWVTGLPPSGTGPAAAAYEETLLRGQRVLQWCAESPDRLARAVAMLEAFQGAVLCPGCNKRVKPEDACVRFHSRGQVKTCVGCAKCARRWKFHGTTPVLSEADLERASPKADKERLRRLLRLYTWGEVGQESKTQDDPPAPAVAHRPHKRARKTMGVAPAASAPDKGVAPAASAPGKGRGPSGGLVEAWLHPLRPGFPRVPLLAAHKLSGLRGVAGHTQVPAGLYELRVRVPATVYRATACYVGAGSLAFDSDESALRYKDLPIVAGAPIADHPKHPGCWEFNGSRGGDRVARFGTVVVRPGVPHVLALLAVRTRQVETFGDVLRLRQYAMVVGVPATMAVAATPTTGAPSTLKVELHGGAGAGPSGGSDAGSEEDDDAPMAGADSSADDDSDDDSDDDDSDDELSDDPRQYVR